jgi:hypothetical protein
VDEEVVFMKWTEEFEAEARKLGLYLMNSDAKRTQLDPHSPPRPVVAMVFLIGDEAFSDRVQHPENYSDEKVMGEIEHATYESEAEAIARRYAESGGLFAEDDADE